MLAALLANIDRPRIIDYTLARRAMGGAEPGPPLPLSIDERRQRAIELKRERQRKRKLLEELKGPIFLKPEDFDEPLPTPPQDFPLLPPDPGIRFRQARQDAAKEFEEEILKQASRDVLLDEITRAARETVRETTRPRQEIVDRARDEARIQREIEAARIADEIAELERQIAELEEQDNELEREEEELRKKLEEIEDRRRGIQDDKGKVQEKRQALSITEEKIQVRTEKRERIRKQILARRKKLKTKKRVVSRINDDEEAIITVIALLSD